jgi:2-polyprenyl-6-methoxyphenol hydroxylase-like FAD-dependent oxidoreductase
VLKELGLLQEFLSLPHEQVESGGVMIGGANFEVADFRHLPTACKFIALMPQWDFLNFLSSHAKTFPSFQLRMQHEVTGLLRDGDRITGIVARNDGREVQVRADLVVGCDGRHSLTRSAAGLEVVEHGVPIDVLWFRISRRPDDPAGLLGNVNHGRALILINRSDYFQAGELIEKGSFDAIKARGLEAFRDGILQVAPYLGDRVNELQDWDQIKILTVQINRLERWYVPGLLCIGDAAHAMSPAGGVGINLAIQDAIAAARLLAEPLEQGFVSEKTLAAVQRRREFPTRVTQSIQLIAHRGMGRLFLHPGPIRPPWQLRAVTSIPGVQRLVGRVIGLGARPEHVREPRQGRLRPATVAFAAVGMAVTAAASGWLIWKACRRCL